MKQAKQNIIKNTTNNSKGHTTSKIKVNFLTKTDG
jgi:hypothetical protein